MTKKKPESETDNRSKNHSLEEEPSFNTVLEPEAEDVAEARTGISRASAVLLALLATLAGGAIGWVGPGLFDNSDKEMASLQATLDQTRTALTQAETDRSALKSDLTKLQRDIRTKGTAAAGLEDDLSSLRADIEALKTSPEPVDYSAIITEINERISALNAFTATGVDGETPNENVVALVGRLEALEQESGTSPEFLDRLEKLETALAELNTPEPVATFPEPDAEPIELPDAETPQSAEASLRVLIDSFPREKMLEAVKAQEILAQKKPSWLQRMLSRHVKVRDDNLPAPAKIIDQAEAALADGEVAEAVRLVETLNPPVRTVAADWISAAKKASKLIEKEY